jgi:hypothetical protein
MGLKRVHAVILPCLALLALIGLAACSSEPERSEKLSERPAAPANDDFREDSAQFVANTGRPQLVEVFHYQ